MAGKRFTGAWLVLTAGLLLQACAPLDSLPSPRAAAGATGFKGGAFEPRKASLYEATAVSASQMPAKPTR